ncbi:MAG TPA: RidA family protein [Pseudolysinimonas sp.]|jgi:2-iminobutanoate/2-iminopropanoate deaminase|nr:RidA family protein [Pseudolysinimonas sp.]
MTIEHINPESMTSNPAFSQGTIAPAGRTLYIGGQNGIDANGDVIADKAEQVAQAMRNVLTVLEAAGAEKTDVAKLTIYLHADLTADEGYGAVLPIWGRTPTAVTVVQVAAFARPGVVCEIDAIATLA